MISEDLSRAESVRVEVQGLWGKTTFPAEVLAALRKCLPDLVLAEAGTADIRINWHDDLGETVCVDHWEPRCDAQVAIATVSGQLFEAHWARSRPSKCLQTDCLFKLFLKDLQAAACRRN